MQISINQVGPGFAGEVHGIDLTKKLSPKAVNAVHDGMDAYAVLVFRRQPLTSHEQLTFSQQL